MVYQYKLLTINGWFFHTEEPVGIYIIVLKTERRFLQIKFERIYPKVGPEGRG